MILTCKDCASGCSTCNKDKRIFLDNHLFAPLLKVSRYPDLSVHIEWHVGIAIIFISRHWGHRFKSHLSMGVAAESRSDLACCDIPLSVTRCKTPAIFLFPNVLSFSWTANAFWQQIQTHFLVFESSQSSTSNTTSMQDGNSFKKQINHLTWLEGERWRQEVPEGNTPLQEQSQRVWEEWDTSGTNCFHWLPGVAPVLQVVVPAPQALHYDAGNESMLNDWVHTNQEKLNNYLAQFSYITKNIKFRWM